MTTTPSDKSERESSPSLSLSLSPGSITESTTSESSITGSITDGSITDGSITIQSSTTESTITEPTTTESRNSESSDSSYSESSDSGSSDSTTMGSTPQRKGVQWYELREGWTLHRFEEKTEFKCHQCNKMKKDVLVAMKPENNHDNMCCNACFCMKIGTDSDQWNLVPVDGIDHIW
jgi:hypothetical protein